MPTFSVVIPTYNHGATLGRAVSSVLSQEGVGPDAVEVVVADDGSADDTLAVAWALADKDPRVSVVSHPENTGTLRNRRDGVLATRGPWVMLMDADDELAPGALETLAVAVEEDPAQIVHFGVEVVPETPAAVRAAAGMAGFLTPAPRRLEGDGILAAQLAGTDGFDWHLHHRLFDGELVRSAYGAAADERLIVADDIYLSFIICSLAGSYRALPDAPLYRYHLGAGDTFGSALDVAHLTRLAGADATALRLARAFAAGPAAPARDDWEPRLADLSDRLSEHVMNEWWDNLPEEDRRVGLDAVLSTWGAEAGAAAVTQELWRFLRDSAYGLWVSDDRDDPVARERLGSLHALTESLEAEPGFSAEGRSRHGAMRAAALGHLTDLGVVPAPAPEGPDPAPATRHPGHGLRGLFGRLFG